jgi:hypothetical protein
MSGGGPLAGVTVVELARVGPVPFAAMLPPSWIDGIAGVAPSSTPTFDRERLSRSFRRCPGS